MALFNRLWTYFSGDTRQLNKQTEAFKIGILGAANICNMALINPASKLPNVLIYGVAARDRQKAEGSLVSSTNPQIDHGMRSELILDGIKCDIYCEFTNNWSMFKQQIVIDCERVTITISNLIAAGFYHYVTIRQRDNGQTRTIKNYADN